MHSYVVIGEVVLVGAHILALVAMIDRVAVVSDLMCTEVFPLIRLVITFIAYLHFAVLVLELCFSFLPGLWVEMLGFSVVFQLVWPGCRVIAHVTGVAQALVHSSFVLAQLVHAL